MLKLTLSKLQTIIDILQHLSKSWIRKFFSVPQPCLTLWDPMKCSTPGFPVHHQPPELAQTHLHWVSDAIQPSHPLSSPSPALIFPSIRVFSKESILCIRQPKCQSFSFIISPSKEYSGLISCRMDWLDLLDKEENRSNLRTLCYFSIVFPRASLSSSWLILNTAAYVPSVSA